MKQLLLAVALSFSAVSAQAALISMNDGDSIAYNAGDTYQFLGELSATSTILSYGFLIEPGELFNVTINAPVGVDITTAVTAGRDFTGMALLKPNILSVIDGGTSITYPIDGNFNQSSATKWVNIAIEADQIPYIQANFGGAIQVGGIFNGTDQLFNPNDNGGGTGNPGGNGDVSAVPLPGALPLLASVIGLGFISRKGLTANVKV